MDMIGSGACVRACVCVHSNVINTNLQSYTFRYFLWLLLFLIKILLVLNIDINIVYLQVVCAKRLSLCFTFHIFRSLNVKRVQLQYHRVTFFSLSVYACGICYKFSHAASPFYSCFTDRRGGEIDTWNCAAKHGHFTDLRKSTETLQSMMWACASISASPPGFYDNCWDTVCEKAYVDQKNKKIDCWSVNHSSFSHKNIQVFARQKIKILNKPL